MKRTKKDRMVKNLAKLFLLVLLVGAGFTGWTYVHLPAWAMQKRALPAPADVKLVKGGRLRDFAQELQDTGAIDSAWKFRLWIRFYKDYSKFQAGPYRFEGDQSPASIVETVEAGKTFQPYELQFVIPEGFTLKQVIERLFARNVGTREELWAIARDKELLKKYRINGDSVEGFLFPATYSFEVKPPAREVFEKMLRTFYQNLPEGLEQKLKELGLDLHQAVIFASLIERETLHDEERPKVAEVIWNRLHAGETLGIDAALIYGIEDYKGDITWKHLRDEKNPYNTRIHKGLPPGPIGAVSIDSLEAILTPTHEGYKFYVLKNDGSSYHNFSRTLAEHNRFVKQLTAPSLKH